LVPCPPAQLLPQALFVLPEDHLKVALQPLLQIGVATGLTHGLTQLQKTLADLPFLALQSCAIVLISFQSQHQLLRHQQGIKQGPSPGSGHGHQQPSQPQRGRVVEPRDAEPNDPGLAPLDTATIHQLHSIIRSLPRPALEGFTKAFRKRFQVPPDAPSNADRICQRCHHYWIEAFLVQHQPSRVQLMPAEAD
jgi:hypothetical protein